MMFVSFNVNSIRTRLHQLEALIESHNPDIIGLQETKVRDEEFPVEAIRELGYHVHFHGQKTHYGVALLSRIEPEQVIKGYPGDDEDAQRRLIAGQFTVNGKQLTVINGYFPQGESRNHPKQGGYVVIMGDMNISPTDKDIGIGPDNAKRWLRTGKCSFLPEEREWLGKVESRGYTDVFRYLHPDDAQTFSWFDYRSKGFEREPKRGLRIDLIMANDSLLEKAREAGVAYDFRGMERPSDHCPVWATFEL